MLLLLSILSLVKSEEIKTVTLDCGDVEGTATRTDHGRVYEFYQIPYAVQPVGERRWTHSEPLLGPGCWDGTYKATAARWADNPIKCVQAYWPGLLAPDGREDCLHLTVRTPSLEGKAPVLVWIHGGSLLWGYSEEPGYAPTAEFAGDVGLVTVNINYRLDVMGFFSDPDIWSDSRNYGNFGIGDALTALKWVQKNIAQFGGDPDSITILGESSGATIVMGLLGTEQADGLFHKAISLSGPPTWKATYQDAYDRRKAFASKVGCDLETSQKRRDCLKSADVMRLIKSRDYERGKEFYDFPFGGGIRGESMDYNVIEPTLLGNVSPTDNLATRKRLNKVQVIVSNTGQETGTWAILDSYQLNQARTWEEASSLLDSKIQNLVNITGIDLPTNFLDMIKKEYNFAEDSNDWWPQIFFDTLTTDLRTTCLNNDLVDEMNENEQYEAYRMYVKSRPDETNCGLPWTAIHGWDTEALFDYGYYGPHNFDPKTLNDRKQRLLKDSLRAIVESFARHGVVEGTDPGSAVILENSDFPVLGGEMPQKRECEFWRQNDMLQFGWQN